ncbi:MAG: LPP20 family lipoprotein, partial [Treponema sp.]|nr:LPP20 family lipoprotein [Treponema sp.]
MKKFLSFTLAAVLLGSLAGCASTGGKTVASASAPAERKVPGGVPDFVKSAMMNVPEDALIGIGTAKMASLSQSMTIAQTRARADLSRQLNTMIQDMVRDYTAGSEVDPSAVVSFQENFTLALSKSTLQGSHVVEADTDAQGNFWAVVSLSKSDVAK